METKYCIHCGEPIDAEVVVCPKCFKQVKELKSATTNMKYCKHCGEKIDAEVVVCPKCFKQVEQLKSDKINDTCHHMHNDLNSGINSNLNIEDYIPVYSVVKQKWVALLLCIFLGMFGVHKFYEGKIVMGVLYLLTVGLFGIGWLIDIILLLGKSTYYEVK